MKTYKLIIYIFLVYIAIDSISVFYSNDNHYQGKAIKNKDLTIYKDKDGRVINKKIENKNETIIYDKDGKVMYKEKK